MPLTDVSITRNEVSKLFSPTEVKKGADKGKVFLGPSPVTEETLQNDIKWIGGPEVCQYLTALLRLRAMGWAEEAEDESAIEKIKDDKGNEKVVKFDEQKYTDVFSQLAKDFSARGETIKEIQAQIDERLEKMSELSDSTDPTSGTQIVQLARELKALQIAKNAKRRKTKEDKEAEASATN